MHHELTIQNHQRDARNIIYSSNIITLLYMFRLSSTHLQEDIVVHKQWRYHMLLVYNYVLLKMSTWYSKHVEESNNIWRINNIQCITLVVLYDYILITTFMHWLLFIHKNTVLLYMFRSSSAHLQEDRVVHMQHMVLSLSMWVRGGLSVHSLSENWL